MVADREDAGVGIARLLPGDCNPSCKWAALESDMPVIANALKQVSTPPVFATDSPNEIPTLGSIIAVGGNVEYQISLWGQDLLPATRRPFWQFNIRRTPHEYERIAAGSGLRSAAGAGPIHIDGLLDVFDWLMAPRLTLVRSFALEPPTTMGSHIRPRGHD